jgi:hypothetical protein
LFLIFLALTAGAVRKVRVALLKNLSNWEKDFREGIIINMLCRLYSPVNPVRRRGQGVLSKGVNNVVDISGYNLLFLKILPLLEDLNGVYFIDSKNLRKFILPPE